MIISPALLALFLFLPCTYPAVPNAGLVGIGTSRLFEYVGELAIDVVHHHMTSAHLGNLTTTVSAPVLGDVDITLSDIYLRHLDTTNTTAHVSPQPNGSMLLDMQGITVHVETPLSFRRRAWPHISGHGTAYINAHGGGVVLVGTVKNDGAGRPCVQLVPNTSRVHFEDVDVRIGETKAAFLFNIVLLVAHQYVEARIQQEVGWGWVWGGVGR